MEKLYSTLRSLEAKEQQCLDEEDFVRADTVHSDWEKTTKQIQYIESEALKGLNNEFGNSWRDLSKLMRQESDAAAKAAEACVTVKVRLIYAWIPCKRDKMLTIFCSHW